MNHLVKWLLSYIKQNGIIHYQLDAAHKLFNQIDCYITNWVGYCHPSSIFLWSCSPVSAEDTLWMMMSMRWNETPRSPAWSSEDHLTATVLFAMSQQAAGNADLLIFKALVSVWDLSAQEIVGVTADVKGPGAWLGFLFQWDVRSAVAFLML